MVVAELFDDLADSLLGDALVCALPRPEHVTDRAIPPCLVSQPELVDLSFGAWSKFSLCHDSFSVGGRAFVRPAHPLHKVLVRILGRRIVGDSRPSALPQPSR